jgi:hypothetical protein
MAGDATVARYPDTCPLCHLPIKPGDAIVAISRRKWRHAVCPK